MRPGSVLHLQKVAGIAGSETHLLSLLPALRQRGWDIRMLMLHEREPGAADFAAELAGRGVPIDALRLRGDVDPIAFVRLATYLLRHRPALLHTHLVHGDVYGQLAGLVAGVPARLSTKHGFNEFREGRGFALADRLVASLADVHIAVSRGLARYLAETEGFSEDGFQIVHYGIHAGDKPAVYRGPPRLLCIGRLIPIKGHLVLLRAFAAALERVPELELWIAGSVRFLGHVAPIQQAIEDAAIVVVPSMGEGFGMVALESMERARPVIASAVGGLVDIVEDGVSGLLVPPGNVEALRDAIVELATHRKRAARMGAAGRRHVVDWFADERTVDRTELLYLSLLDGRVDATQM